AWGYALTPPSRPSVQRDRAHLDARSTDRRRPRELGVAPRAHGDGPPAIRLASRGPAGVPRSATGPAPSKDGGMPPIAAPARPLNYLRTTIAVPRARRARCAASDERIAREWRDG